MIISRTPLRISLMGGSTDVAAFYEKNPGCVVSFTIDRYIYISVNKKFDGNLRISYSKIENVDHVDRIQHDIVREMLRLYKIERGLEITSVSDIPASGTGLGSSSTFTVGLLKALDYKVNTATLAERAYTVERTCGHPVGKQDVYASSFGGINFMEFKRNNVKVEPILPGHEWIREFESEALLLWTGLTRDANQILGDQQKAFEDGRNVQHGIQLARLAHDFHIEFMGGADNRRIGEFLQEGWQIKKALAKGITNHKIENMYDNAMRCGAYGGKLLGAGGGGFLFFLAPQELHQKIINVTGLRKIGFKMEMEGSKVIYNG